MSGWRIFWFLVLALFIFLIITQPEAAAHVVESIGAALVAVANSIITFFRELL
jgi:hypothetical protein